MAWNIVRHAFIIVFGNWREALKASVVPFLILVAVLVGLSAFAGVPMGGYDTMPVNGLTNPVGTGLFVIVGAVTGLFVFGWIAVTWHRFILLEEYPAVLPTISNRPIWPYVGRMLMIVLQMMVVMIPMMLVLGPLMANLLGSPVLLMIVSIAMNVVLSFVWLRVSVSLPSVAVGRPMGSVDAWSQTKAISQEIFLVSIIMILLNVVASLIVTFALGFIPVLSSIASLGVQWVSLMVGVSVLTTIYGHVVEGRPLRN